MLRVPVSHSDPVGVGGAFVLVPMPNKTDLGGCAWGGGGTFREN